jgi:hypothetical protein
MRMVARMSDQSDPQDEVIGVTTLIGCEQGRWVVYLEVAFPDHVRRHRIRDYPTEQQARVAAEQYRRAALRDAPPPTGLEG